MVNPKRQHRQFPCCPLVRVSVSVERRDEGGHCLEPLMRQPISLTLVYETGRPRWPVAAGLGDVDNRVALGSWAGTWSAICGCPSRFKLRQRSSYASDSLAATTLMSPTSSPTPSRRRRSLTTPSLRWPRTPACSAASTATGWSPCTGAVLPPSRSRLVAPSCDCCAALRTVRRNGI